MNFKLIFDLYQRGKFTSGRHLSFIQLLRYFLKIKIGEITGKIYKDVIGKKSDVELVDIIKSIQIIDSSIRDTLLKILSGNTVDIRTKKGFENIGYGCLISPTPLGNLIAMTQNEASFFFLTEGAKKRTLKITLLAVPKISGNIQFEGKKVGAFSINTLSEYQMSIDIQPELVNQKVSKVTVTTDRFWSPNYLDKNLPDFPLGIAIQSMILI